MAAHAVPHFDEEMECICFCVDCWDRPFGGCICKDCPDTCEE